jgi:hypothetical protein
VDKIWWGLPVLWAIIAAGYWGTYGRGTLARAIRDLMGPEE